MATGQNPGCNAARPVQSRGGNIVHYVKRGNRWFCDFNETRDTTPAFYFNTIDAIPFFRGLGGYERVTCGYCVRGYVPLEITSISPDRKEKTVRKFKLF